MTETDSLLQNFSSISLTEMETVSLMDRVDTKYVFSINQLPQILENLSADYNILEINNIRKFRYESLYFDTIDFRLYNYHHSGRLNRYKVRYRNYVDSGLSFFEIKFRNNTGRTIKKRIQHTPENLIFGDAMKFLHINSNLSAPELKAVIKINYTRITLISKSLSERVTLDLNLEFKTHSASNALPGIVIAEVKQMKTGQSFFRRLMKDNFIQEGAISKYCHGIARLYKEVRRNNFKPHLMFINKLTYASSAGH